jgi:hypothetical protein
MSAHYSMTPKLQHKFAKTHHVRSNVISFLAGAMVAIPLALVALAPSPGDAGGRVRVIQAKPVEANLSCSQPTVLSGGLGGGGGAGGGQVLGESITAPLPVGGAGGGNEQAPTPFVQQFVLNATASINNTGPDSNNTITSNQTVTTNITNNNNLNITNTNNQSASSGDATVSGNTTGGSAETGDATNDNATNIGVSITN